MAGQRREDEPGRGEPPWARGDVGIALAILAAGAAALAWAFQPWLAGDGPHLLDTFLFEHELWMHVLYLPVGWALERVLAPIAALKGVSVLGGALGAAGTFALARGLGVARGRAAVAAGLALATPAVWFFATTIEVHALHLGAVAVVAAAVVLAPARPRWAGVAAACIGAPLVYLTHKSGALVGPGLVALAGLAQARRGTAFTRREWVLALGLVGAAFVASVALGAALVRENSVGSTLEFLERFQRFQPWAFVRDGVLGGLGVLLPLACVGWARSGRAERLASAAYLLPVVAFFTWYGEANRGAYFTALVPVMAWLAARGMPRGARGTALLGAAAAAQLVLAIALQQAHFGSISREQHERRVALVRDTLGEHGTVLSFRAERQPVTLALPEVRDINLRLELARALGAGSEPERAARDILGFVRQYRGKCEGPLALELAAAGQTQVGGEFGRTLARLAELAEAELGPAREGETRLFLVR